MLSLSIILLFYALIFIAFELELYVTPEKITEAFRLLTYLLSGFSSTSKCINVYLCCHKQTIQRLHAFCLRLDLLFSKGIKG